MRKMVDFINWDFRTDVREKRYTAAANVFTVVGPPLLGWAERTHTVGARIPGDAYPSFGHATLTDEEAASLPHTDHPYDVIPDA